ncbi:MAG: 50S ribosomal protein L29 [Clostridiales bacterium]|nr:50S ribosomal protein L29 [Clostridiales bacterium]MBO4580074.1 50S ribosomal protein L29 [Clostridiales bacterium]
MKADEIRKMSTEELNKELASLKEELFKLRFRNATNQLENTSQINTVKKDIARVKTVIREQELKAAK